MGEEEKDKNQKYNGIKNNLEIIDTMANDVIQHSLGKGIFENKKIKQLINRVRKTVVKNVGVIDKNTIVYQLPGTGEIKYKNYDKITMDIKRIEISIRKENALKRKQKYQR